ncbi:MAG: hypothetical protein ACKO9H_20915 [Planctomycetota bacterium]
MAMAHEGAMDAVATAAIAPTASTPTSKVDSRKPGENVATATRYSTLAERYTSPSRG